jgi:hypothetical protein
MNPAPRWELNRFTAALWDYCQEHVLEEKWVLAPSMRAGFQWVDRVARSDRPVINLRVKMLRHLALELAAPEMERRGFRFLRGVAAEVLVGGLLSGLRKEGAGYLLGLDPSLGLVRTIHGSLRDLRLAGIAAAELAEGRFEVPAKGVEIRALLAAYEEELKSRRFFDAADVLRAAAARLRKAGESLMAGKSVLLPADQETEFKGLERGLWEAIPAACRVVLAVDRPGENPDGRRPEALIHLGQPGDPEHPEGGRPDAVDHPGGLRELEHPEGKLTDAGLLSWLLSLADAPAPPGDGSAGIFRAVGEVNEVREVLRRCVEGMIPFDQVEILHTDQDTYVPLIYELAWHLHPRDAEHVPVAFNEAITPGSHRGRRDLKPPPVTFSEGIPPRYSRPARCLLGWLSWIREDYPQSVLARMIQDGLLEVGEAGRDGAGVTRLAARLRGLPVGSGRDRYLEVIDREIDSLRSQAGQARVLVRGHGRGEWEESETETETGTETGNATAREAQTETEIGTEPGTATETESGTETETGTRTETGTGSVSETKSGKSAERLEDLRAIRSLVADLLGWAGASPEGAGPGRHARGPLPAGQADSVRDAQTTFLQGALSLLEERARRVGEFDEYAHERLTKEIRGLIDCLDTEEASGSPADPGPAGGKVPDLAVGGKVSGSTRDKSGCSAGRVGDRLRAEEVSSPLAGEGNSGAGPVAGSRRTGGVLGFDAAEWLSDLAHSSHIFGMRPQPGCLHVAHLDSGGHSGRPYTFILGLDDTRFPVAGTQDPVLLDRERGRISPELPTAGRRLAARIEGFARLLAGLRGKVFLSYCCRNLADDREMFPSPLILSAYRVLSGNREGDLHSLLRWLPEPASFAPTDPGRCLDLTEWWLWRLCGTDHEVVDPEGTLGRHFPHLGRGFRARRARRSDRFTEYDGWVPAAGRDLDPFRPAGPVLSASRLEKLGTCPLEYFFQYVLGIEPPEEYETDPALWLDARQKGELLHKVFRQFMSALQREGLLPNFERDWARIELLLEDEISAWQRAIPPPNREVFERERRDLKLTGRIFLMEEEDFCRQVTPRFFEVAVGLPSEGAGSPLDSGDPAEMRLAGGKSIRVRGRIDRVDELPGSGNQTEFAVWDYKTGSAWKYREGRGKRKADPFDQGRLTQGILYLSLAEALLRAKVSPRARVVRFGYFFPGAREHGERLGWQADELKGGREVLEGLCRMLATGCFPFTNESRDLTWSEYGDAFCDTRTALEDAQRKFENPHNAELEPIRRLRGFAGEEE